MDVSNADVYQMMTYGQLHNSQSLTLLYPHSSNLKSDEGRQLGGDLEDGRTLSISTFDLANPNNEEARLKKLLLQKSPVMGDI